MTNTQLVKNIIDKHLGTPYVWWNENMIDCGPQSYADDTKLLDFEKINKIGMNCSGLINIIRKSVGLEVPGVKEKTPYAGGSYFWFEYLKKNKKLKKFNVRKVYPEGTLLLRQYKDGMDQGHMAVIYESNHKGVLFSKLAHAYSYTPFNPLQETQKHFPGLKIDNSVGESHFWYEDGLYTHVCMPKDWLSQ